MEGPHVRDALPIRLLVSGALYGRGKRIEATARIVTLPACEPKSFRVTLDAHGLAGAGEKPIFSAASEGVWRRQLQDPMGSC